MQRWWRESSGTPTVSPVFVSCVTTVHLRNQCWRIVGSPAERVIWISLYFSYSRFSVPEATSHLVSCPLHRKAAGFYNGRESKDLQILGWWPHRDAGTSVPVALHFLCPQSQSLCGHFSRTLDLRMALPRPDHGPRVAALCAPENHRWDQRQEAPGSGA